MKRWVPIFAVVAVLAFGHFSSVNAEKQTAKKSDKPAMEMSAEQKTMMEAAEKRATPNENHRVFDTLVGKWNHSVSWWMSADGKPEESKGTNTNRWIFGKRFLRQEYHGVAMGKPFEAMAFAGYDNVKQEYTSIWLDNMSTGMMMGHATFDAANKTFHETGTFSCPMTGEKDMPFRAVWTIKDHDHYSYEMYVKNKEGKEYKSLEVAYVRASEGKPVSTR